MESYKDYIGNLWVNVAPGKGVENSGKCVAVRCASESFNMACYGDPTSTSTETATKYNGEKAINGEHWIGLDWTSFKKTDLPLIKYQDNSVSLNTNVSIQDAYNAYTNSVFSKNVFWACVPDGVDLGMSWYYVVNDWAGMNPRTAPFGVVFSRLF